MQSQIERSLDVLLFLLDCKCSTLIKFFPTLFEMPIMEQMVSPGKLISVLGHFR